MMVTGSDIVNNPQLFAIDRGRVEVVDVPGQQPSSAGRRWPVSWLALALVIEQPSHGYEIARRYASRFGWFQPMPTPRIYAALAQLYELNLVEEVELETIEEDFRKRPPRRSYQATAAGERAYRQWVAERFTAELDGVEVLQRLVSVGILGVDGLVEVVQRQREQCLAEIHALSASGADSLPRRSLPELARWLTFDQYRRSLEARMAWTADALAVLEGHRSSQHEAEEQP